MNQKTLTTSEREVLELRMSEKTFREIAEIRGCALSTVLCLSSNACRKIGIRKSTNPSTLAKALSAFDAGAVQPVNPMNDPAFL